MSLCKEEGKQTDRLIICFIWLCINPGYLVRLMEN